MGMKTGGEERAVALGEVIPQLNASYQSNLERTSNSTRKLEAPGELWRGEGTRSEDGASPTSPPSSSSPPGTIMH